MRTFIYLWLSNTVIVACLGFCVVHTILLLRDDLLLRMGKAKIVSIHLSEPASSAVKNVGPGGTGTVEFTDPRTGLVHRQTVNSVAIVDRTVGEEIDVSYLEGSPAKFSLGNALSYRLKNTMRIYMLMGFALVLTMAVRLFLNGETFRGIFV